jgi:hypothetical protein
MYKPKHFILEEFIDKETFENIPEWKLWFAMDERILRIADILREDLGVSVNINNWKWGRNRQWAGIRPYGTKYYSQWSQHSYGRALDMLFKGIPSVEVRKRIKELMEQGKFKGITKSITCEETAKYRDHKTSPLSWVHLDVRNNKSGYNEFYI